MTTAHRPTFDPAVGKEASRGPAYHQRLLPAFKHLKVRKPGQGGAVDGETRDLRAELLEAEAAHFAKLHTGSGRNIATGAAQGLTPSSRQTMDLDTISEDAEAKRRRVLEESRDVDAESDEESRDDSSVDDSDDDDDEDETAELQRELEKIKRERAARREAEERERAAAEEIAKETDIAQGNPLLNPKADFNLKRRWDDDVVFKNQARGTEDKRKKEFVNDLLRSDFHKRFMSKYVR